MTGNAGRFGGGASSATFYNCTIAGNWGVIKGSGSGRGGGAYKSTLYNSIIYFNLTTGLSTNDCDTCLLNYCCSPPESGSPVVTDDPMFVDQAGGDLHLQSNSPCVNAGHNAYAFPEPALDGNTRIVGGIVDMGAYELPVPLTNYVTHYVSLNNTNPSPPYTNWASAAVTIQDAINVANIGDHVLVSNGVYRTGGTVMFGALTNRVAVNKRITVESVNGPAATVIEGYQVPGTTNGAAAVRCVYLANGAILSGFTLTNGATLDSGDWVQEQCGAGVWCQTVAGVSNCVLISNAAEAYGGGAYQAALDNCQLIGNSAFGGGGGAMGGSAFNSILVGNHTFWGGGGASGCSLNSCTVVSNWAYSPGPSPGKLNVFPGGGVSGGSVRNSVVYYNYANEGPNYFGATVAYCCITPDPGTEGNITSPPLFADLPGGNLRLQTNSPCINAGDSSQPSGTDLDGRPRVVGGRLDMGAYEFQNPALSFFNAWLQGYGLPTDGSADYWDVDDDGMNNSQEWIAGTIPNNSSSALKINAPNVNLPAVVISWQSVTNRMYSVQRAADLASGVFSTIASNVAGQAGTTSFADTNAAGARFFYRVAVE